MVDGVWETGDRGSCASAPLGGVSLHPMALCALLLPPSLHFITTWVAAENCPQEKSQIVSLTMKVSSKKVEPTHSGMGRSRRDPLAEL